MRWDPEQYGRFAAERGRPFLDLVARIDAHSPARVTDLGCGPGTMTARLAQRWPAATVVGIDSSPEMIGAASAPGVTFHVEDVHDWTPVGDVVISNAVLQWVPDHQQLLRAWCAALPAGAWLAWQVPNNFAAPGHALLASLSSSPRWRSRLRDVFRPESVATAEQYARLLLDAGWSADVWETTYQHVLSGPDAVLKWMSGTGLRPVLQALEPDDAAAFRAEYAEALQAAYPSVNGRTLFSFRRIFAVGHKQPLE